MENDNGEIETDSKERAEILNNFFTSVFTNEDTANIPDFDERNYETPLTNIQINEEDVKKTNLTFHLVHLRRYTSVRFVIDGLNIIVNCVGD